MKPYAAIFLVTVIGGTFICTAAHADGGLSVAQARAACEKRGEASDPKRLAACCDNLISPQADYKREKQMIAECIAGAGKGKAEPKSPSK